LFEKSSFVDLSQLKDEYFVQGKLIHSNRTIIATTTTTSITLLMTMTTTETINTITSAVIITTPRSLININYKHSDQHHIQQ
jgi:hypothetical protein